LIDSSALEQLLYLVVFIGCVCCHIICSVECIWSSVTCV